TDAQGNVPGFAYATTARPDLRVTNVSASPASPAPGQNVTVSLDFANVGNQTAHDYEVFLSTSLPDWSANIFAGEPGPSLAPGQSAHFEGVLTNAQPGEKVFGLLDPRAQIPDANRADNSAGLTLG